MIKFQKISKQSFDTFPEQSALEDSVYEETELSKEEQNDRIILLLSCCAILINIFGFVPTFILLISLTEENSMINSMVTIAGECFIQYIELECIHFI